MRVTMREVAERAGVSVKTVSRVVNGEPYIRPETLAQVQAAIAELDWTPNASARTLRTGRTGVLGIMVAELRRPLLAALVEALVTEVDRHGLHAAVEPIHDDATRLADVLAARGRTFDALLAVDAPALPAMADDGGPLVRVDVTSAAPSAGRHRVYVDRESAGDLLLRHLRLMGRSRIVRLGHGPLDLHPELPAITLEDMDRAAGYRAAQRAIVDHPQVDALVCGSDEIALGVLAGLHAAGVEVPGRVAVSGFGDLEDGRFATPSLTTLDPDPAGLARAAVDMALTRLRDADAGEREIAVPVTLVRRESTMGESPR
ncbi:LacI family DNA-binding transcriptional regulator [Ruania halotolerans]|uniref:LacI family DNA-binding transcriptional regulator n=1 Tax=Ruania halotolerans TaxID=2897773 RepID=UPI001E2D84C0|nr:LacI family DNA-binding transcriptional regulator [Ruania halotolerans]UFU06653.1 LacI family transcriptional regulator [Ruania halotolerans]